MWGGGQRGGEQSRATAAQGKGKGRAGPLPSASSLSPLPGWLVGLGGPLRAGSPSCQLGMEPPDTEAVYLRAPYPGVICGKGGAKLD